MTYTPTTAFRLRNEGGSLAKKLAAEFTAIETEMNAVIKVAKGTLTAGNANAYAFAWQNPESSKIIVQRAVVDVTTAGGTATSVLDVGSAADGTTHSDNLIDGADLNAVATYDNIDDQGTNGKSKAKLDENGGTTDYITGQILVANAASLVGKYYIEYMIV